eukprot:136565-Rhodomonas_salina.2
MDGVVLSCVHLMLAFLAGIYRTCVGHPHGKAIDAETAGKLLCSVPGSAKPSANQCMGSARRSIVRCFGWKVARERREKDGEQARASQICCSGLIGASVSVYSSAIEH